MNDELPSIGKIIGWIFFIVIGSTFFFGVLGLATGIVSLPFRLAGQANRVLNKTIDADNVIYNYEYFKKVCQEIKAQDGIIRNSAAAMEDFEESAGPRVEWDYNDKNEHAMLRQNVTGAKNTQQRMIAEYNGRAKMMNRAIFNTEDCNVQVTQ